MTREEAMQFCRELSEAYQGQGFDEMSRMLSSVTDTEAALLNDELTEGLYAVLLHMRQNGIISIRDNRQALGALIVVFALGRLFEAGGDIDTELTRAEGEKSVTTPNMFRSPRPIDTG